LSAVNKGYIPSNLSNEPFLKPSLYDVDVFMFFTPLRIESRIDWGKLMPFGEFAQNDLRMPLELHPFRLASTRGISDCGD